MALLTDSLDGLVTSSGTVATIAAVAPTLDPLVLGSPSTFSATPSPTIIATVTTAPPPPELVPVTVAPAPTIQVLPAPSPTIRTDITIVIPPDWQPPGNVPNPTLTPFPCPERLATLQANLSPETLVQYAVAPPDTVLVLNDGDVGNNQAWAVDYLTELKAAAFLRGKPVDCARGLVLVNYRSTRSGQVGAIMTETPALLGFQRERQYRYWFLNGDPGGWFGYVTGGIAKIDPTIPWGGPGPGNGPGGTFGQPGGAQPGTFGKGISIGGVNLDTILGLLGGAAGHVDVTAVVEAILAIVLGLGNIKDSLGGLPSPVVSALSSVSDHLGLNLLNNGSLLANQLGLGFNSQALATLDAADAQSAQTAAGIAGAAGPSLEQATAAHLGLWSTIVKDIERIPALVFEGVFRTFHSVIDANAEGLRSGAVNVRDVAGQAITKAFEAGVAAHLVALGLEAIPYLKHIGVTEFVGFLTQFSGFDEITKPLIHATLKHGLGTLSEYEAAARFRNQLPNPHDAQDVYARYIRGGPDYLKVLHANGIRDEWSAILNAHPYHEPRPREIERLADGMEVDPKWLVDAFRRAGWREEDVQQAVQALQRRMLAKAQTKVSDQLLTEYVEGRLDKGTLQTALTTGAISETSRLNLLQFGDLKRRANRMEKVGKAGVAQYVNDIVSRPAAQQLLEGLGFTADEITVRLTVADLERTHKLVAAEQRDVEAQLRQVKSAALANLKRQLRVGFISADTFVAAAQTLGYDPAYAAVVGDLELMKGAVAHASELPDLGLGAVEDAAKALTEILAREVQAGNVSRAAAELMLTKLGAAPSLLREILDLAVILGIVKPGEAGLPTFGQLAIWEEVLTLTLELLAKGFGSDSIFAQLVAKLHLPANLQASVADLVRIFIGLFSHGRQLAPAVQLAPAGGQVPIPKPPPGSLVPYYPPGAIIPPAPSPLP